MQSDRAFVVRVDLPTPDVAVVRHESGELTVLADGSLTEDEIDAVLEDFEPIPGTGQDLDG